MNNTEHTPDPWIICNGTDIFTALGSTNSSGQTADDNDGWQIADCSVGKTFVSGELASMPYSEQVANARRIVAAVNACKGISIEELETGGAGFWGRAAARLQQKNARLLEALKKLTMMARTSGGTAGPDAGLMQACEEAEAAIAKATGPAEKAIEI